MRLTSRVAARMRSHLSAIRLPVPHTQRVGRVLGRRLAWFLPARTEAGDKIPAKLSARFALFLLTLPWTGWFFLQGLPIPLLWNVILLAVVGVDDFIGYRNWHDGEEAGRNTVIVEMAQAWQSRELTPEEFLVREVAFAQEDVEEARETVVQSMQVPKRTAGRHADVPRPRDQGERVSVLSKLPTQLRKAIRRTTS